jgi:hypothetical protein
MKTAPSKLLREKAPALDCHNQGTRSGADV